ncbi:hypothetical protein G6F24_008294 [Rhizopus arrhizus]|nr:hypothetical protein G6F24_008294 [Rhizopus arrhizus]
MPTGSLAGATRHSKNDRGYLLTPRCARCRPADKRGKLRIPALPTGSAGKQPETACSEPLRAGNGRAWPATRKRRTERFWVFAEGFLRRGRVKGLVRPAAKRGHGPLTLNRSGQPVRVGAGTKGAARHPCSPSLTAASGPRQGRRRRIGNSRRQVAHPAFEKCE